MIIYTEQKTANAWFWTIHNAQTGVTYYLAYNISDKGIRLTIYGLQSVEMYDIAALEFWKQLTGLWNDVNYHGFVREALRICKKGNQ